MSIRLKRVEPVHVGDDTPLQLREDDAPRQLRATYQVAHPDPRSEVWSEMTLDVQVPGRVESASSRARMVITTPWLETPQAAVDKLADWLERLAKGMREGKAIDGFGLALLAAPVLQVGSRRGDENDGGEG